jgi:hypothetical protein
VSSTFSDLKSEVSEMLRDPDLLTFDDAACGRLVNMAVAEVSRIAPLHFQEDITPVEDTLDYTLRSDYFSSEVNADIEVARVELWDGSTTPSTRLAVLPSAASGYVNDSETGWSNWGGTLHIPRRIWSIVDGHEADYLYRVWGYSPYAAMTSDSDVFEGSEELKWAVVRFAQREAVRRLMNERDLFTQWQTRSGNTDITPGGLASDYNRLTDELRMMKRELYRHRVRV